MSGKIIKFKEVTLRNFMSYGNNTTTFTFDHIGTTLILGENLDSTVFGVTSNGLGKALTLDSKIKTPSGWTTMGEIKVNDKVTTPSGEICSVVGVYPQGAVDIYKVTFQDGRYVEACSEHLWKVESHMWVKDGKSRQSKLLSTKDLIPLLSKAKEKKKAWYNIFVPLVTHPDVPDVDLPLDPYLLGCLLGDGGFTDKGITFTNKDHDVINAINNKLTTLQATLSGEDGLNWRIKGSFKHLTRIITELGLKDVYSHEKFIPEIYMMNTSVKQKEELLAGLIDTDGFVSKTHGLSFCTTSKQLSEQVQYLVRSLGGIASVRIRRPFYYNKDRIKIPGKLAYDITIRYKNQTNLVKCSRKKSLLNEISQYGNSGLRISNVEYVGKKEAQCISVDHPDKLYITNDFIVTHNTTLLNALTFAAYDKALSNISKDNLINNINKKNMVVTTTFEKGEDVIKIERARKAKDGNYVKLWINDKDVTRDSIANTNAYIEQIIGIPYDMFVHIVVFSATRVPFLELTSAEQTAIMEHLNGLTELSVKADVLKEKIKDTQVAIKQAEFKIEAVKGEHQRHEQQLISAKNRIKTWQDTNNNQRVSIQNTLEKFKDFDFEAELEIINSISEKTNQLTKLKSEKNVIAKDLNTLLTNETKWKNEIKQLNNHECPYCHQHYADTKTKLNELLAAIETNTPKIKEYSIAVDIMEKQSTKIVKELEALYKLAHFDNMKDLSAKQQEVNSAKQKLADLETAVNPFIEPLKELESIALPSINYDEINELTKLLEHQKFLQKILTKKDSFVRKVLLEKNLPYLNKQLKEYLNELGLPHKVEFTSELTARISSYGREIDFGNLSNGQRARVNLSLSLAFRDLLQKLHDPINICMFDEVLDVGLDALGIQAAAKLIKRKAKQENLSVYIISHRDEVENIFENILTVQMSNGFSQIKET